MYTYLYIYIYIQIHYGREIVRTHEKQKWSWNGLRNEPSTSRYHNFRGNLKTNPCLTLLRARNGSNIWFKIDVWSMLDPRFSDYFFTGAYDPKGDRTSSIARLIYFFDEEAKKNAGPGPGPGIFLFAYSSKKINQPSNLLLVGLKKSKKFENI